MCGSSQTPEDVGLCHACLFGGVSGDTVAILNSPLEFSCCCLSKPEAFRRVMTLVFQVDVSACGGGAERVGIIQSSKDYKDTVFCL